MKILQLTAHYQPNLGGVETHLSDLVMELVKKKYEVTVLTYIPLTTNAKADLYEKSYNVQIIRIPWIKGLFYQFVSKPFLEFAYLFPGLFLITPVILLLSRPNVIHAHGLVAGIVGMIWAKIFGKRIVLSLHSIYHFPHSGLYRRFVVWLFSHCDKVLCLSNQSKNEVISLGIDKTKVVVFTYWIDLEIFHHVEGGRKKLDWMDEFNVLFVGRLVPEKGVRELLSATRFLNEKMHLYIAGAGPLEDEIKKFASIHKHVSFLGRIIPEKLPIYYSAASVLIVPSTHEEGFGRVLLESLACSTPVIAANRGAIPDAIDSSVGRLITISPENIAKEINNLYKNPEILRKLSIKARDFAEKRYSKQNIDVIINTYLPSN